MGSIRLHLNMAGVNWRIETPYALEVGENYQPFLCEPCEPVCSYRFEFGKPEHGAPDFSDPEIRVWKTADGFDIERKLFVSSDPSACIRTSIRHPLAVQGWIYPGRESSVKSVNNVLDIGCMEYMLSALRAINLHSSFIRYRGEGILFTAPSGTGKSTQADLWETYTDAEQLNGDRSVIRCTDGIWTAYGFPFAGSSKIFRNESAPIRAIVVLRQAAENTVSRLRPGESFRLLYSETAIQRWNDAGHTAVVDQLLALCRAIPVYLLRCTPDERAVRLLETTIFLEDTP